MDWLKDKKNQPIVAGILAVVIVAAVVLVYMTQFRGSAPEMPATTGDMSADGMAPPDSSGMMPPDTSGAPGAMPGAPAGGTAPGTPAAAPAAPAGVQMASATPMETWRGDPFLPVGYKPPVKNKVKPKPRIIDFPFYKFPTPPKELPPELVPEPQQPVRRMAGILLNDRVYAIIESNGQSEIVQPGDVLKDRLAKVEKIEADKVILKTTTDHPRYLVVRMASSPNANDTSMSSGSPMGRPSGRPMPYMGGPPGRDIPGPPM